MASSALRVAGRFACRRRLSLQCTDTVQPLFNCLGLCGNIETRRRLLRATRESRRLFSAQKLQCGLRKNENPTPGSAQGAPAPDSNKDHDDVSKGKGDKAKESEDEWNRSVEQALENARREMKEGKKRKPLSSKPSSSKSEGTEEKEDYLTTLGRVMMELPTQLEGFFERGIDGGIYSDKIIFSEPTHSGLNISGKPQYIGVAKVLRIAMNTYFTHPSLTILSIRQIPIVDGYPNSNDNNRDTSNGTGDSPNRQPGEDSQGREEESDHNNRRLSEIHSNNNKTYDVFVRWVFEGLPRHTEIIGGHESRYEGEFRYRIDPKSGLIVLHEVAAIHPAPPTAFLAKTGLARWAGWLTPRGALSLSKEEDCIHPGIRRSVASCCCFHESHMKKKK
ncbi:hypothetical protein IWW48_004238 [Coemansia sp. RSA 1200]|nr:hypothetical protein IWW48_004238 [Coemansia sp. RSA 1200]